MSIDELNEKYKELQVQYGKTSLAIGSFWESTNSLNRQSIRREQSIIRETIRMKELIEQVESGSLSLRELEQASRSTDFGLKNLGEEQLEPLRSAIRDAKRAFQDLNGTINDSFDDIEDRLDAIKGNQEDIVKRRFKREMDELLALLAQAQESGDSGLINKINEAIRNLKEAQNLEFQDQFGDKLNRSPNRRNDVNEDGFNSGSTTQRYEVTLNTGSGSSTIAVSSPSDAEALIDFIADLGEVNTAGVN